MDADWYPDPSNPSQQRFWDGVTWTNHLYGPQGQGTDGGLTGAPPPGAAADFPEVQPPASTPWSAGAPSFPPPGGPSYPPPGAAPYVPPGYGPPPGGAYGAYGSGPAYAPPGAGSPAYAPPGPGGFHPGYSGPPGPWSGSYGRIGRPTSPGIQILLTIVTLGIWEYVWTYRQYRDLKDYSSVGVGGVTGLLLYLIPSVLIGYLGVVVTFFLLPSEVQGLYQREGRASPVSAVYGVLFLLPFIGWLVWYVLVQRAINDFWIAHGAPRP